MGRRQGGIATVTRSRRLSKLLIAAFLLAFNVAGAATWPQRPITMIVPFPTGSSPDTIARLLSEPLAKTLGQPVLVENKPGAGGNIGTRHAAQAAADGYTLLFTINGPLTTAPTLYKKLGYAPLSDFAPVTLVATSPNVLVIDPTLNIGSVEEFVAAARKKPGVWNYGSVGAGSASHLAMEMLKHQASLDIAHVPYAGFPAITAALANSDVQASFMVPAVAMPMVKAGKIKALAVTSKIRMQALRDLPTMIEQGIAGFEAISWQAILAPAQTPKPVIERLNTELVKIIRSEAVRDRLAALYFEPGGTAPEAVTALMKSEKRRWDGVIEKLNLSLE
jgi:tripartite-type tricarboxylate transporter receptor subunit TctC